MKKDPKPIRTPQNDQGEAVHPETQGEAASLPTSVSAHDINEQNRKYWDQWK